MHDFLTFRRMLTPIIIQLFFWAAVGVCIIGGVYNVWHKAYVHGLHVFIVGPIIARVFCEFLMVFFRINETLNALKSTVQEQP